MAYEAFCLSDFLYTKKNICFCIQSSVVIGYVVVLLPIINKIILW